MNPQQQAMLTKAQQRLTDAQTMARLAQALLHDRELEMAALRSHLQEVESINLNILGVHGVDVENYDPDKHREQHKPDPLSRSFGDWSH